MTEAELTMLDPFFRDGERYLNGQVIDWSTISYRTMFWLVQLRNQLQSPIRLIRGAHPNRPSAVDACCPSAPLAQIFMALTRLQQCSWGIYSGCSFHVDTREFSYLPARWLAVRPDEEVYLSGRGLTGLIVDRKDGWLYLSYAHPRALEAALLVCELAERQRGGRDAAA
jgi:hypothetical protein